MIRIDKNIILIRSMKKIVLAKLIIGSLKNK